MNQMIWNQCEEMIRQRSSSFYQAFRGLPSPRREAVYVIYAFCRMIDDSVDEPENAPYSIGELQEKFLHLKQAQGHFIWSALRWLFAAYPQLDQGPFLRQMEGQRSDLILTHYTSLEELEHYCYLVAGTVGEMLLPVLRDTMDSEVTAAGIAIGKGMQIVNIIRDVGEDVQRGRRYIPLELMHRHGYTQQQLEQGVKNEAWVALLSELQDIASQWLKQGLAYLDTYPASSALSIELAATFYGSILKAVERNNYDVFTKRAFVTDEEKQLMLMAVLSKQAIYSSTHQPARNMAAL